MGQSLSEPVTHKETSLQRSDSLLVGSSCMQGWRVHMEDAHVAMLTLPPAESSTSSSSASSSLVVPSYSSSLPSSYFAVFDGHGGSKVARYAAENLHRHLLRHPAFLAGQVTTALIDAFLQVDAEMQNCKETRDELAGSTALAIVLHDSRIFCANAGDSRAVLSVSGVAVELSRDHKPSNVEEKRRIVAAGGWVDLNRVNGNLALSRALGDFVFKRNPKKSVEEQVVTAKPDVIEQPITDEAEFIVMACDGIWDVLTNQEVVNFVRPRLAQQMDPDVICEDLMTHCLAPDCHSSGLGCDNMTVMIIGFLHNGGDRRLFDACATQPKTRAVYLASA